VKNAHLLKFANCHPVYHRSRARGDQSSTDSGRPALYRPIGQQNVFISTALDALPTGGPLVNDSRSEGERALANRFGARHAGLFFTVTPDSKAAIFCFLGSRSG